MTPVIGDAIEGLLKNTIGKVIDGLVDKYLPASMSEADKEKMKQEAGYLLIEEIKANADAERVFMEDRKSAREREIAVKDKTPSTLAYASFVGFFGVLGLLMFIDVPASAHDALMIMLGALGTIVTSVVAYYFGSSSGSAEKSKVLHKILDK